MLTGPPNITVTVNGLPCTQLAVRTAHTELTCIIPASSGFYVPVRVSRGVDGSSLNILSYAGTCVIAGQTPIYVALDFTVPRLASGVFYMKLYRAASLLRLHLLCTGAYSTVQARISLPTHSGCQAALMRSRCRLDHRWVGLQLNSMACSLVPSILAIPS